MKNVAELHTEHTEIKSDIAFLKKEIGFLLKLLRNAYSISVNMEKIRLLDGYWKGFEEYTNRLDLLLTQIRQEEKQVSDLYKRNLIDEEKTLFNEEGIVAEFYKINKSVKTLKESFYEYMSGCCACSLKNS